MNIKKTKKNKDCKKKSLIKKSHKSIKKFKKNKSKKSTKSKKKIKKLDKYVIKKIVSDPNIFN